MDPNPMNLVSPSGTVIVATLERLHGRALIVPGSARPASTGGFEFDYEGTTEIGWDEQRTAVRDDERVFVDADGDEFLESELTLAPLTADSPPSAIAQVITVTMEGGLIQGIEGIPAGVTIRVLDFDTEGAQAGVVTTLPSGEQACVSEWPAEPEEAS